MLISSSYLPGQTADGYDTLYCRGGYGYMLIPKYDTLKQLEQASDKSDTILEQLAKIMDKLNINDTIK